MSGSVHMINRNNGAFFMRIKHAWFPGMLLCCFLMQGCERRQAVWERAAKPDTAVSDTMPGMQEEAAAAQTEDEMFLPQTEPPVRYITVYVYGEVAVPDVYILREGSRIYEAVDAAGGFLENADREWCNLAQILHDGEMLQIYSTEETGRMRDAGLTPQADCFGITPPAGDTGAAGDTPDGAPGRININTATKEQLMTLPGIGQSRAGDIISYRERHGAFGSIEEIQKISGIKSAVFEKIKDLIVV